MWTDLDVVEADLTHPAGGLDDSARRRLREMVETVIHCAGDTVFFPDDMIPFRQDTSTSRSPCSKLAKASSLAAGLTSRPATCVGGDREPCSNGKGPWDR